MTNHSFSENVSHDRVPKPYVTLTVFCDDGISFRQQFLLDTGSDVSILPTRAFKKFFQTELDPFRNARLTDYNNSEIPVYGVLPNVHCQYEDRDANVSFLVCNNETGVLGVDAIAKLQMSIQGQKTELATFSIQRITDNVVVPQTGVPVANKPKTENRPTSLPKMKGFQFFIQLKENAPSSLIQKPRRVPFALESAIEEEISKLLRDDIIEEVDSSPFLSPIVVVPKGENGIRLCVDYKKINKFIVIDQHPLPTADEIFSRLSGAQVFSKLDLRSAYHQLEIMEDSRNLTAFTSHVGQFRYKRLPFGLANAPSAYMKVIFHILRDCPNAVSYLDDILIFGKDLTEHDRCLHSTLRKLEEYGITLNEDKCQYRQTCVQFLGRILSKEGISPLPKTMEAIQNAEEPCDKHSLRAFMGLINFYRNFIPNASLISTNLYELLKENVAFKWTDIHSEEFKALKDSLNSYTPLAFFDSNLDTPTYITTDASGYGIAAVLSQIDQNGCDRPIYFLSRKLSEAERTYSATEKEFLAVLWGVERLHQYLYGRPFVIRTDHQCLKQLLCNGIEGGSAPCRVIRWATRLLQYNYSVEFIPGKKNTIADALSRVPHESEDSNLELYAVHLSDFQATPLSLDEIRKETAADMELQSVIERMEIGWPDRYSQLPETVKKYWNVRKDLSLIDGVLYRNEKVIVPAILRGRILNFAHEGHMGISKCKTRIREYFWWPGLNFDVEMKLRTCGCCHEAARESPVQVPNYASKPWHQVAIDIKGPIFDSYHRPLYILALIDCYTKFATTRVLNTITSKIVIQFLKDMFAIFGNCMILTSDNGPQFVSHEFVQFLQGRGIVHRRSSVYNPQSNGVVERFNKNLTKLIGNIKNFNAGSLQDSLNIYTQNYITTKHNSTGKSPSELIFTYPVKTNLCMFDFPGDEASNPVGETLHRKSTRNAWYANTRRRPRYSVPYKVGDKVLTKQGNTRNLKERVGPYTFEMDDGHTINTRNIARRVAQENVSEPIVCDRDCASPVLRVNDSACDELQTNVSTEGSGALRRSMRDRKRPSYLNDYLT